MGSNGASMSSSLSSPFESRGHNEIMANNYLSEEAEEDELLEQGQNGGQNGQKLRRPSAAAEEAAALRREDFLVSFLVDARGGSLKGCRYSGVKVSETFFCLLCTYQTCTVFENHSKRVSSPKLFQDTVIYVHYVKSKFARIIREMVASEFLLCTTTPPPLTRQS